MVKSLIGLILIGSLGLTDRGEAAPASGVYLGGTFDAIGCSVLAGQYGYNSYAFGGYVNGIYYWNACLGYVNVPQTDTGNREKLSSKLGTASIDATLFYLICARSPGYSTLSGLVDRYSSSIENLRKAVKDGVALSARQSLFSVAMSSYRDLAKAFYPIHAVYKNQDIHDQWLGINRDVKGLEPYFVQHP